MASRGVFRAGRPFLGRAKRLQLAAGPSPASGWNLRFLFVHQNAPGQFSHLARHLTAEGHEVRFLTCRENPPVDGLPVIPYRIGAAPPEGLHPFLSPLAEGVRYAVPAANAAKQALDQGFKPDIVVAHAGWGETLFLKDVYPDVPLLSYAEFFYRAEGADVGFRSPAPPSLNVRAKTRLKNAVNLLSLDACDRALAPTRWQKSVHPPEYLDKIEVIHEGVDVDALAPNPRRVIGFDNGLKLSRDEFVVTFATRSLEPYRGFDIFMRAIPEIQRRHPDARIVIVGRDKASYGGEPKGFASWREKLTREVEIPDPSRVHWFGWLRREVLTALFQVTSAHVYLTYPFVLSWSMLEAMSCGAVVIGSRTPPVQEMIEDGVNGLLVDFDDVQGLADRIDAVRADPAGMADISRRARETIVRGYALKDCIARQKALMWRMMDRAGKL